MHLYLQVAKHSEPYFPCDSASWRGSDWRESTVPTERQMKERRFWFHRNKNFPLSVVIQMEKRLLTSAPNDRLQTRAQANVILVPWKFCFKGGKLCVQKLHAGFKSRTSLKFFRPYFHYCLSSVHCCEDHFHLLILCSHLWFSYIHNDLYTISRVYYESP